MAKNNSGLFLGIAFLGVAGVGAYFYFKEQGIDVFDIVKKSFSGGNAPASLSIGTKELPSETHDEIIMPSKIKPSSVTETSLPTNYGRRGSSTGTAYTISKGSSGHTTAVIETKTGVGNFLDKGISVGKSLSRDAPTGAMVFKASEIASTPNSSSITSKVKNTIGSILSRFR